MEISIVIISCVILGLNPEMPFLYFNLNGFCRIKCIHTYIHTYITCQVYV